MVKEVFHNMREVRSQFGSAFDSNKYFIKAFKHKRNYRQRKSTFLLKILIKSLDDYMAK